MRQEARVSLFPKLTGLSGRPTRPCVSCPWTELSSQGQPQEQVLRDDAPLWVQMHGGARREAHLGKDKETEWPS